MKIDRSHVHTYTTPHYFSPTIIEWWDHILIGLGNVKPGKIKDNAKNIILRRMNALHLREYDLLI